MPSLLNIVSWDHSEHKAWSDWYMRNSRSGTLSIISRRKGFIRQFGRHLKFITRNIHDVTFAAMTVGWHWDLTLSLWWSTRFSFWYPYHPVRDLECRPSGIYPTRTLLPMHSMIIRLWSLLYRARLVVSDLPSFFMFHLTSHRGHSSEHFRFSGFLDLGNRNVIKKRH